MFVDTAFVSLYLPLFANQTEDKTIKPNRASHWSLREASLNTATIGYVARMSIGQAAYQKAWDIVRQCYTR